MSVSQVVFKIHIQEKTFLFLFFFFDSLYFEFGLRYSKRKLYLTLIVKNFSFYSLFLIDYIIFYTHFDYNISICYIYFYNKSVFIALNTIILLKN